MSATTTYFDGDAHACNCIGCCPLCGTCRTWAGHTRKYCELIQRQLREREDAIREWARGA